MIAYLDIAERQAKRVYREQGKRIDLDDLKSEAYFGLVKLFPRYCADKQASMKTYLYSRLYWHLIDYVRKQSGRGSKRPTFEPLDTEPTINDRNHEHADEVCKLLELATDEERKIMIGIMQGMTIREIARIARRSEAHLYKILKKLRRQWRIDNPH